MKKRVIIGCALVLNALLLSFALGQEDILSAELYADVLSVKDQYGSWGRGLLERLRDIGYEIKEP